MSPLGDEYTFRIDELIARYTLEPTLRHLFVEGESDAAILDCYARDQKLLRLSVFPVSLVFIPSNLVKEEFGAGNRGRVVALAHQLSDSLAPNIETVYCIADNDFYKLFDGNVECRYLVFTDFNCLESYALEKQFLQRLFSAYFNVSLLDAEFDQITRILERLFLLRAAHHDQKLNIGWVSLDESLTFKNGVVYFDESDFLNRSFSSRGKRHDLIQPLIDHAATLNDAASRLGPQDKMHKDDFMEIFCALAKARGVQQQLRRADVFSRVLLSHIVRLDLIEFPLFAHIRSWAA